MRSRGFSLIELIAVILVLAAVATISTQFIVSTLQSYDRTQTRSKLLSTGRQAMERMTRQLRGALPYSLRESNGNVCLQFLPIAGGGNYQGDLPDASNGASASEFINTAPYSVDFGSAVFVSVGAMASGELYGAGPVSLATLSAQSASLLTLNAQKVWQRNSINKRFYLLNSPQAFCLSGSELRFYENHTITSADIGDLADPCAADCEVLARDVSAGADLFAIAAGTEDRNTRVSLDMVFSGGGEQLSFVQEVLIRNVP